MTATTCATLPSPSGDKVNNYGVNDLVPVIDQVPDVQVVDLVTD